ncbi:hypothetical protein GGS20DRAFT_583496 [Poronia punctata]|nr:hypothetical protein GGS20DRAFT_583496 [Poronia punctata]
MAAITLTGFGLKTWLILSITYLASLGSATDASIHPEDGLPDFYRHSLMKLTVASHGKQLGQYGVAPLTPEAGLNVSDIKELSDINGNLVIPDQTNFDKISFSDNVIYLACDAKPTSSDISVDDILNGIMNSGRENEPTAILLYSEEKAFCFLGGSSLPYNKIWTMTSREDSIRVRNALTQTSGSVMVTINPNSPPHDPEGHTGTNSAIAMSILYSITGLITVLFLFIIATGAIRAHRNPERYGPRASTNGRPRRSRARGVAMAMLETLPIVKFGESDSPKRDEENALDDIPSIQTQQGQQAAPQGSVEETRGDASTPRPSSDAIDETTGRKRAGAIPIPPTTETTADKTKKEEGEEDHLGCSICTEDFTVGEDVRVLPCNHKFHPACVDPWLVNVSGTCPLCRLDLRPPEEVETAEADRQQESTETGIQAEHSTRPNGNENASEPVGAVESSSPQQHRRRRSRLLDWNRLRHATVDERIQALRQYRQSEQADNERRHSRLSGRLLGRFHARSESRSSVSQQSPPSEVTG